MFSFFFFKQKTAYEMRISDWSSYVCSADLAVAQFMLQPHAEEAAVRRGVEAFAEIRTYVEAQIDDRLSTGSTDDVLGLLAAAKDREGLSHDEITATAMQLVFAGAGTSSNGLANTIYLLLRNPAQLEALRADPALVHPAINEGLDRKRVG